MAPWLRVAFSFVTDLLDIAHTLRVSGQDTDPLRLPPLQTDTVTYKRSLYSILLLKTHNNLISNTALASSTDDGWPFIAQPGSEHVTSVSGGK